MSHLTVCKLYCKLPSTSQELASDQRMCPRYCEAQTIRANWAIQRWLTCRVVCKLQIPSTYLRIWNMNGRFSLLHTVFPHIVSAETILFWLWLYVLWPLITVHKCAETIQGRKLYEEIRYVAHTGCIGF